MSLTSWVIKVSREAINTYDTEAQKDMCIEECSELINAIEKHRRGRNTDADVVTEIADVIIMCTQMAIVFGWLAVVTEIKRKIDRLAGRILKYKKEHDKAGN